MRVATQARLVSRKKVKSGCRTCKLRKVKCDEGHPVCYRCRSTGRVCDGYGVWGGGGNHYADRQVTSIPKSTNSIQRPLACASKLAGGTEEKLCLDWFKCRTAKELPGLFVLTFWDTLLHQAILAEPAVFHAVLTLGSLHRQQVLHSDSGPANGITPDAQEQFLLKHYSKAINHLQPHFSNRNRSSIRVALITCVLFISLEFLRGNFRTAKLYLHNGLHMLAEIQVRSRQMVDDWIFDAFSRLHVQTMLFKQDRLYPLALLEFGTESPRSKFNSFNGAWQQLERLFNKVFTLSGQIQQQKLWGSAALRSSQDQQRILSELQRWLEMFESFSERLPRKESEGIECLILRIHYSMANIMAQTCLWPDDECIYDAYTAGFVSLLSLTTTMWEKRSMGSDIKIPLGHDMSKSHVDIGWIPALFYTVLKCRVHRVRLHAVRLLESASHREGIWDSKMTACAARKVMELEERDFYGDTTVADGFSLACPPDLCDLSLPLVPRSYRIRDVYVALPDGLTSSFFLYYSQQDGEGEWHMLLKEYNVLSQAWMDKPWCSKMELVVNGH